MSQEVWFPETWVAFDVSCCDLDVFGDLSGEHDSMFDIVAYVWLRQHMSFLQQIAGEVSLNDLTPAGTMAVWSRAGTLRQRAAAVVLHQLHYVEKMTVCYEWYPELSDSCHRKK